MAQMDIPGGYSVLVDDDDLAAVSQHKWYAFRPRTGNVYARNPKLGFIHRFLIGDTGGLDIDHADGDGLNNTRANLRVCTRSQNSANSVGKGKQHPFKGVAFAQRGPRGRRYMAQIMVNRRHIHLGTFDTMEEAAMAYDIAATKAFGEYAKTNFGCTFGHVVAPASRRA